MGFFDKIKAGLTKTRDALSDSLSGLFSGGTEIDDDFYEDLTPETACKIVDNLKSGVSIKPGPQSWSQEEG